MKDLREWGPATSPYEVFSHLVDLVLSGRLSTFAELKAYGQKLLERPEMRPVLLKVFSLQKKLHWGFFKSLSPEAYPRLWAEVVEADQNLKGVGDLRRTMAVPGVYLGLMDIHGYTKFCHKSRREPEMLGLLDQVVQVDMPRIAALFGVLSRRARGDEILLLGARASDVISTILAVMDFLSGELKPSVLRLGLPPDTCDRSRRIPVFRLSAGVAGGQKYSSLLITKDGDLSGDIVNMAARLQHRANAISPELNKVLVTSHVHQKLLGSQEALAEGFGVAFDFVCTGRIHFKGLSLKAYDLVFVDREPYRLAYRSSLDELLDSLDKGLWKGKLFQDALNLSFKLVSAREDLLFRAYPAEASRQASKDSILEGVQAARICFNAERFIPAVENLSAVVQDLGQMDSPDELALFYLRAIVKVYATIIESYAQRLDQIVAEKMDSILGPKERENFAALRRNHEVFGTVRKAARLKVEGRKAIFAVAAEDVAGGIELSFTVQK